MTKITPIINTKFTIPAKQGKDIYSPIQKLVSANKIAGIFTNDKLELSTYSKENSGKILDVLTGLQAKFKMITKEAE